MEHTVSWGNIYHTSKCITAVMPRSKMERYLVLRNSNRAVFKEDSTVEWEV